MEEDFITRVGLFDKKKARTDYKFVCPNCGEHVLLRCDEVLRRVPITNLEVWEGYDGIGMDVSQDEMDWEYLEDESENRLTYTCPDCGFLVTDEHGNCLVSSEFMERWIREHIVPVPES